MTLDELNTLLSQPNSPVAGTAQEISDWSNAVISRRLPEKEATHWSKSLGDLLGPIVTQALLNALDATGLSSYRKLLESSPTRDATGNVTGGGGIDFGNPQTQAMLDSLGATSPEVFTSELVQALKALGVSQSTPLRDALGIDSVDVGDIQTALDVKANLHRLDVAYQFAHQSALAGDDWNTIASHFSEE